MSPHHLPHYKNLCSCQKVINNNAERWMYPIVVPSCRCRNEQTTSLQIRQSVTVKTIKTPTKGKSFQKSNPLLYKLLSVLRHEEDVNSVVIQGKRWVFLPHLNLSQRLSCSHEDVLKSLHILYQKGYIEALYPSSEDVEKPPFFRVNRNKYHDLCRSVSLVNKASHQ